MRSKLVVVLALVIAALTAPITAQTKLKVGFIYVGPIGDYGWTHAHDVARKIVEKELGVETLLVENVPDAQTEAFIDKLVQRGVKVVFATSFGFMDGTIAAAKRYPNVIFAHATGYKRAPNVATYNAEFYQIYYLNGLVAGALTKSNQVCYLAAFPIPELKRHISAFALGVQEVNPKATVRVVWTYDWFNPAKAKEATEALIASGCDVGTQTEDSPTFVQVMAKRGYPSFSHYSPMHRFAPQHVVSGQLVHWERFYVDFVRKVLAGKYTADNLANVDYWGRLGEGAVEMGADPGMPINPFWVERLKAKKVRTPDRGTISVYDLVNRRLAQMSVPVPAALITNPEPGSGQPAVGYPKFDPFEGPIYDRRGKIHVAKGDRASYSDLMSMEWAVKGIVGPWPNEK